MAGSKDALKHDLLLLLAHRPIRCAQGVTGASGLPGSTEPAAALLTAAGGLTTCSRACPTAGPIGALKRQFPSLALSAPGGVDPERRAFASAVDGHALPTPAPSAASGHAEPERLPVALAADKRALPAASAAAASRDTAPKRRRAKSSVGERFLSSAATGDAAPEEPTEKSSGRA